MKADNAKRNAFLKTIDDASREQKSALIAETEQYKAEKLAEAKEMAQKQYDSYIEEQTLNFAVEDEIEAERRASILKKEVIDTRAKITENVFSAVKNKLAEFTGTAGYESFLANSAKEIAKICEGCHVVIFMRSQDMKFADTVKAASDNISVEADDTIKIGGLYGICAEKSIKLNDLLETRLEAQKEWFYENSSLSINH